jgi:hypothetical protein
MDLRDIGWSSKDWFHPDEDKDRWRALVNTITNIQVP